MCCLPASRCSLIIAKWFSILSEASVYYSVICSALSSSVAGFPSSPDTLSVLFTEGTSEEAYRFCLFATFFETNPDLDDSSVVLTLSVDWKTVCYVSGLGLLVMVLSVRLRYLLMISTLVSSYLKASRTFFLAGLSMESSDSFNCVKILLFSGEAASKVKSLLALSFLTRRYLYSYWSRSSMTLMSRVSVLFPCFMIFGASTPLTSLDLLPLLRILNCSEVGVASDSIVSGLLSAV